MFDRAINVLARAISALQANTASVALVIAVAAIIVPAWLQIRREKAADRERELKTSCFATAIELELRGFASSLATALITATAYMHAQPITPIGSTIRQMREIKIDFSVAPEVINQAYLLGDPAAPTILRLLYVMAAFNHAIEGQVSLSHTEPKISTAQRWTIVHRIIREVQQKVDEAVDQVAAVAHRSLG